MDEIGETTPSDDGAGEGFELILDEPRTDAERAVSLEIWQTKSFPLWYAAHRRVGNKLVAARPEWVFHAGNELVFFWALWVSVWIKAEQRVKDIEVVISRPDMSAVVMYQPGWRTAGGSLDDSVVVLVREFRSAGRTDDGFIHELPGGSPFRPMKAPGPEVDSVLLAADECKEETGLAIDAARLRAHGSRQVAGTMSAHHTALFSVELTDSEVEWLRDQAGKVHGVDEDTEQTVVEVTTLGEIRSTSQVDWSTLGEIFEALA
jgi:8-oxo-dGTP pyrophosphatase MutT (NUDIX family)